MKIKLGAVVQVFRLRSCFSVLPLDQLARGCHADITGMISSVQGRTHLCLQYAILSVGVCSNIV